MELTTKQIKEGNEKLAKILGWYEGENKMGSWFENDGVGIYVAYSILSNHPHNDLPFHRDWNYLMKVVDKIGTIVYHRDGDDIEWYWKKHYSYAELYNNIFQKWLRFAFEEHKQEFNLMNDLTSIWSGCVAYVDWYNNEKE